MAELTSSRLEPYDPAQIGKLIAMGGDRMVYTYGSGRIIKFSRIDLVLGHSEKAVNDTLLCKKYFGDQMLETAVQCSPDEKRCALVQPRIYGRSLRKKDLEDVAVREEFMRLLGSYRRMCAAETSRVDLMGLSGLFFGGLGNVFVTSDHTLRIIDATLMDVDQDAPFLLRAFFRLAVPVGVWRQEKILKAMEKTAQR